MKYSQPNFYSFTQDSIDLSSLVCQGITNQKTLIDLCSGCGVVGIEVAQHFPDICVSLVEIQSEFLPHIEANIKNFAVANVKAQIKDVSSLEMNSQFDIVTMNPPYFAKEASRTSGDDRRDICRTFSKSQLSTLFKVALKLIKDNGIIYTVMSNSENSGKKYLKEFIFENGLKFFEVDKGKYSLFRITKL